MGALPIKSTRDGKGVDLYFDTKTRRAIQLCNKKYEEQGGKRLSEKQFAKVAMAEKIIRDLAVEDRVVIHDATKGKYPLLTEDELEGLPEL